jgi:hypothetical protein
MISNDDEYRFESIGYPRLCFKTIVSESVIPRKLHGKTHSTEPATKNSGHVNLIVASYQRDKVNIHCRYRQLCCVRCGGIYVLP